VSVIWSVPPSGRPAGTRRGASRLGYRAGGGLVAGCTGAATAHVAQAVARVLYLDGPRAAAPPGWLGTGVTGPAGNPMVVSAWHGDLRYDMPVSARWEQRHAIKRARTFRGRRPRRGRTASSDLEVSGDDGQGYGCSPATAK